jgi:glycosyltransferase involved in cell wall biosynthesis
MQNKLDNVKILDFVSDKEEYSLLLSTADCCLFTVNKEFYGIAVPSKTYYYLSAGKPLIGLLLLNSEVDLEIRQDVFGLTCNDYSYKILIDRILELKNGKEKRNTMSLKAESAFEAKYSKEIAVEKYLHLFGKLIDEI